MSDLRGYLDWLGGHGLRFEVANDVQRDPDHVGPVIDDFASMRAVELPGVPPFVEHRDADAGLSSDHATLSLARALLRGRYFAPGRRFWDIGCGTGVLAVAASLAGARAVVATDPDGRALFLARRTAADANVAIRFCEGSLLEPVPAGQIAEVVAVDLPHRPGVEEAGADGAAVHGAFVAQAEARLESGARVFFWLHSLPHPRLLQRYESAFDLTLLSWKRCFLEDDERHDPEASYVPDDAGRRFLVVGVWMARRR